MLARQFTVLGRLKIGPMLRGSKVDNIWVEFKNLCTTNYFFLGTYPTERKSTRSKEIDKSVHHRNAYFTQRQNKQIQRKNNPNAINEGKVE